jgi:hypothetical protein
MRDGNIKSSGAATIAGSSPARNSQKSSVFQK